MHESSTYQLPDHMQILRKLSVQKSANHLQRRVIPASLTRLPSPGSVVEMHNCGKYDIDSLPYATKVGGVCKMLDVILDSTWY